jgi:hypothetical protein
MGRFHKGKVRYLVEHLRERESWWSRHPSDFHLNTLPEQKQNTLDEHLMQVKG